MPFTDLIARVEEELWPCGRMTIESPDDPERIEPFYVNWQGARVRVMEDEQSAVDWTPLLIRGCRDRD